MHGSDPGVAQLVGRLVWELVVRSPSPYVKSEETQEKRSICEHSRVCKTHKIGLTTYLTRTAKSSFSHTFYKSLISGCGPVGRALDLGSRRREFESPHSDHLRMESLIQWFHTEFFFYVWFIPKTRCSHNYLTILLQISCKWEWLFLFYGMIIPAMVAQQSPNR